MNGGRFFKKKNRPSKNFGRGECLWCIILTFVSDTPAKSKGFLPPALRSAVAFLLEECIPV